MTVKSPPSLIPEESAEAAGLRYVQDSVAGIQRTGRGKKFTYIGPDGKIVRDKKTLARIQALVIPPAWTRVWICINPSGHLQATGRDARGRKQYRYHARWRKVRDETKYDRMLDFARSIPAIRKRVIHDLKDGGLSLAKVLATIVRLLETTLIRVGNEEYARVNQSFGLTTLRNRHVKVNGSSLKFTFHGKSGKDHEVTFEDAHIAGIVRRCRDLPGQELFQYVDEEGHRRSVGSADVNTYLQEITGKDFTAKDFRTWAGTCLAATALSKTAEIKSENDAKHNIVAVVQQVSRCLGNTPAICRKCYVHPMVFESYLDGTLASRLGTVSTRAAMSPEAQMLSTAKRRSRSSSALSPHEAAVLALLRKLKKESKATRASRKPAQ